MFCMGRCPQRPIQTIEAAAGRLYIRFFRQLNGSRQRTFNLFKDADYIFVGNMIDFNVFIGAYYFADVHFAWS